MSACLSASSLSVCLPFWRRVCLPLCLLPICLSLCLTFDLSAWLPVCLSLCLILCLPVCLLFCLPVCFAVSLPDCLLLCLSIFLPLCLYSRLRVCLSVCLFVFLSSLRRGANTWLKRQLLNSLRWPIYVIGSVDNTRSLCLSVYLSFGISVFLCVCLDVCCLFVCLSVFLSSYHMSLCICLLNSLHDVFNRKCCLVTHCLCFSFSGMNSRIYVIRILKKI